MCKFFSFCTNGIVESEKGFDGKILYFDWKKRKRLLKDKLHSYNPDSHASIAAFFKVNEDKLNKYEYNPLTKAFKIDQQNAEIKDHEAAKKWVKTLDFRTVIKPLIIKPIIHPFRDVTPPEITDDIIALLSEWDSVWASVGASVRASVGASVRDSVWASVGASVWDSVWASVGASVWASVGALAWASVMTSAWASVWASVWAYISSFFAIDYKHDYSSAVKLWEMGLVPSYDGKTWRLHGGAKAEILYEISQEELTAPTGEEDDDGKNES